MMDRRRLDILDDKYISAQMDADCVVSWMLQTHGFAKTIDTLGVSLDNAVGLYLGDEAARGHHDFYQHSRKDPTTKYRQPES